MALLDNKKQLLLIVVAVAVGLLATIMTAQYVSKTINDQAVQLKEEADARQKETVAKLSAQAEAQANALRQEIQNIRQEQQQALAKQMAAVQAQAAAQAQQAQKPVKQPKPSLAMRTPAGKRAVTVMVDSLAAVGGLLNAGDSVDVIAHLNVPSASALKTAEKKTVTAMIFQNLEVLAVNTNLDQPGMYDEQQASPSLKVTFAVDPQEAGLLSFADKNGNLELALRSNDEHDKQIVKASTWKTLADYVLTNQGANITVPDDETSDKPSETTNEVDSKPTIQIFRGGKEL